ERTRAGRNSHGDERQRDGFGCAPDRPGTGCRRGDVPVLRSRQHDLGRVVAAVMTLAVKRRPNARTVLLDRALEELPLFRLSDTPDDAAISYSTADGGRWRVIANPGDRLPGTFDQDVYVELMRRYQEAGEPRDGGLSFTLHAFLRSIGRQVDGRTYEQLRSSLGRLERTILQSERSYFDASTSDVADLRFTIL